MLSDEEFRRLLLYFDRPWAGFRKVRKGVKKRVRRHMQALTCHSLKTYLDRLDHDPAALLACENCLLVTISRFFRDRGLWDHLQTTALPLLLERFPQGLSAWSAGCAGGEEPYSLAMVWEEMMVPHLPAITMQITATDALPECLERARTGMYPPSSLKEVPVHIKHRWFQKAPGGRQWRIDPDLHSRIGWEKRPLLDPLPQDSFHLIFLRNNLLTYYQGVQRDAALKRILSALIAGGILILGAHERLPDNKLPLRRDEDCPWIYWKT